MTSPLILDGLFYAARVKEEVAARARIYEQTRGKKLGLATVLVGEDPASAVYVRNKVRTALELGFANIEQKLPATTTQNELLALVNALNADDNVHGILVQMPLPKGLDSEAVIEAIAPHKDVDGLNPLNGGLLAAGRPAFVPCTPLGCLHLIGAVGRKVEGLNAVVVGRSVLVGKPVAQLLLNQNCTVTIAHSKTRDLAAVVGNADILVAAVGRPQMIKGEWIKEGAIVIDVGINRVVGDSGKAKLVGDVEFASARARASAITPVPGGVGPMTVAYLMANTARAGFLAANLAWTDI